LRRLYEAEIPVSHKELVKDLSYPNISLGLLEEIGILNFQLHFQGHINQKIITDINKSLMKRYWPGIKKFENEYKKQIT